MKKWLNNIVEALKQFFGAKPAESVSLSISVRTAWTGYKKKSTSPANPMNLLRPVEKEFKVSSPFGKVRTIDGVTRKHNGIDFACPIGTPIRAVWDGEVREADWESEADKSHGYGLRIIQRIIKDGRVYWCWYGHLSEIETKKGKEVKRGDTLGFSGNTGRSTGPHLHFGIRENDTWNYLNPTFEEEG